MNRALFFQLAHLPYVFWGALLGFNLLSCGNAAALELTIIHMNDDHSHLAGESFDIAAGLPAGLPSKVRVYYGGYPRLVTLVRKLSENATRTNRSVLKIHAGDTMTGTAYYTLWRGRADAEMMWYLCFDTFSLGNHEFDDGDANLAAFIDALHSNSSLCNETPVLAANVHPGPLSPLGGKLSKSVVKEVQGEKVGIIGIDIKKKTSESSSPDPGTTLSDEKSAAQAEINALIAAGVNKIILSTHIGYAKDKSWMTTLKGVDVIIGGDSHTLLGDSTLPWNVKGPYPTMSTNADGERICIVQAWEYGHGVGELKVSFDSAGVVSNCSGSPKFPFDAAKFTDIDARVRAGGQEVSADTTLSAADALTMTKYLETLGGQFVAVVEDAATSSALKVYSDQVEKLKTAIIAKVPSNICLDRFPGQGRSMICSAAATRKHGGDACNLVAKAFLNQTATADIAIQQAGGCRTDISKGDFTYNSAYELLPFSNTLVTVTMTGSQVKLLLEDALDFGLDGSSGAYPYASGLRFDVNASCAKGHRITNVEVNSRLGGSWASISDADVYRVVANSYIAAGRDGYYTFTEASVASSLVNTYTDYTQAFIDYAKEAHVLVAPPLSELSTQAYIDVAGVIYSTRSSAAAVNGGNRSGPVSGGNRSDLVVSATSGLSRLPILLLLFVKIFVVTEPCPDM